VSRHRRERRTDDTNGDADLPPDLIERYERAAVLLGMRVLKRKDRYTVITRGAHGKRALHVPTLRARAHSMLGDAATDAMEARDDRLAAGLAALLTVEPPADLVSTPDAVEPLLRPRLTLRSGFTRAARTAARRDAFDDAFYAVALGPLDDAVLLRTEHLDAWGETFATVFARATDNLAGRLTHDCVHEVEGDANLIAVMHETEPTGCAHLLFHRLIGGWSAERGVVFALPTDRSCLCLPVSTEAGARGLARLVRTAYALTPPGAPDLHRGLFWAHDGGVRSLAMTHIEEDDGARVQLEATGPVADLLRELGEIE
jgi:hypothetical protein